MFALWNDAFDVCGRNVAAFVPVTSVEVTCSKAMLALSFSTLMVKTMIKNTLVSNIFRKELL